jgi:outer membrane immunogenic protein
MKKLLLGSTALLALAGAVVLAQGQALAAPDDLDREKAQLRKENADLRELLRMRDENAALRQRLGQKGIEAPAPLPVAQSPRRAAAAPSGQASRAESAARSVTPSVFESYAADMPVKASPPVRAAIYDWTGFYVGANIGYGIGHDRARQVLDLGGGIVSTTFVDPAVAPRGAVGGFQIGYNWQGGRNWLVGFETDFQGASQTDQACTSLCISQTPLTQTLAVEHKIDYFGTVRARLGAVSDNVLFYATGGAAYGRVTETASIVINNPPAGGRSVANSLSETRFGWTAGGGIEAALWGNWTAKAEYLYLDLGRTSPNTFSFVIPGLTGTSTTTGTIRDHIVRAGVNYRFGDAPLNAYASAQGVDANAVYAPVYNWTGFYAGANAGYSAGVSRVSQVADGGGFVSTSTVDSVVTPKGFAGGVQAGYNWQGGRNWLVGFEADLQGTNQSGTSCAPVVCLSQIVGGVSSTRALTATQQLDWFGTLRGRVGAVNNNILFYATGGAAFGRVKETMAENLTGNGPANFTTNITTFNQTGWVAGGGIEAAFAGNWTAKAEYLYLDLGTIQSSFNDGTPSTINSTSTVRDHIFRAGVNYRFAGEPARWWQ